MRFLYDGGRRYLEPQRTLLPDGFEIISEGLGFVTDALRSELGGVDAQVTLLDCAALAETPQAASNCLHV